MVRYHMKRYPLIYKLAAIVFLIMGLKCCDENRGMQIMIILFAALVMVVYFFIRFINAEKIYSENKKAYNSDIYRIDALDGIAFERYLGAHSKNLGYKVIITPPSGDYGVDLILIKDNDRIAVQAKRYKRQVSYQAVQEVVAGKAMYKCNKAMVVTNSTFTKAGRELAKKNNVVLWDRNTLIQNFQLPGAPHPCEYHPQYR